MTSAAPADLGPAQEILVCRRSLRELVTPYIAHSKSCSCSAHRWLTGVIRRRILHALADPFQSLPLILRQ